MTVKLIGTTTVGDTNIGVNYVHACQFTCDTSGSLTSMLVYCLVNSNVRVALYTDNGSNKVGNLVAESASTAITSGAWREITVAGGAISVGTKYWLAIQVETAGGGAYKVTGGAPRGYKAQAYGAFPANGLDFSYDTGVLYSLQGWGTEGALGRSYGMIIG